MSVEDLRESLFEAQAGLMEDLESIALEGSECTCSGFELQYNLGCFCSSRMKYRELEGSIARGVQEIRRLHQEISISNK